jgi:hypothetical protein
MTVKTVVRCDLCGAELCENPTYVVMELKVYTKNYVGVEKENTQRRDICTGCVKQFEAYLFEFLDKLREKRSPKYERKPLKTHGDE